MYVLKKWIESSYPHQEIGCSILTLPSQRFVIMDNYNNQLIIWITTFNAESFITRSCYLRLTLYGYRENPLQYHLKTCNPVSIKPNDYKRGNIINKYYNFASKKRKEPTAVWFSTIGSLNRNVRTL